MPSLIGNDILAGTSSASLLPPDTIEVVREIDLEEEEFIDYLSENDASTPTKAQQANVAKSPASSPIKVDPFKVEPGNVAKSRLPLSVNPMSLRRPMNKILKFDKRHGNDNDDELEQRRKILLLDEELMHARIVATREQHSATMQMITAKMQQQEQLHGLKMAKLRAQLQIKLTPGDKPSSSSSSGSDEEIDSAQVVTRASAINTIVGFRLCAGFWCCS